MNRFAIISLIGAIISFTLGIYAHSKDPKKSLNRIFLLFCISISFLSFAEFGMRQAESASSAKLWLILTGIFPLGGFSLFHLTLIFYNPEILKNKKWISPIIYTIASILILVSIFIKIFYIQPFKTEWGYDYSFPQDITLYYLYIFIFIFTIIIGFFSIFLYLRSYFYSTDILKKKQAKFILFGIIISTLPFTLIDFFILPILFPTENIPEMTTFSLIFTCFFIGYAIWRYGLFSLDLKTASENIFSNISDCLILTNIKNTILTTNKELLNLLGYQEKELVEKPFKFLLASNQDIKLYNYQSKLLLSEENNEFLTDIEVGFKTKDKKRIKISLTASKIYNKYNNLHGIIYIGRNITKTRKIEQQLNKAIKESQFKSEFMATMSHELRTPLNSIIGFAELLLEDYCGPLNKCQTDFLSDIKLSSNDLLELINNLLSLSRIEAGELKLEIKEINIDILLKHIHTTLKSLFRKKNLEFCIKKNITSKFFNADYVRLKEILFNLLNNAVKFTQKGSVTLKISEKNNYFEFKVIDTGVGIAKNGLDTIFEGFKGISKSEIRDSQGVGLGLAITRNLVILHGGHISVSSELGKGSVFTFTIPKKHQ